MASPRDAQLDAAHLDWPRRGHHAAADSLRPHPYRAAQMDLRGHEDPPAPSCAGGAPNVQSGVHIASVEPRYLRSNVKNAAPRPGHERKLLSPQSSDLPVGRFVDRGVQPCLQKYFASPVGQIISTNSRHPTPPEGRIAIVTDAGWGGGGRGSVLRARDRRADREICERSPSERTRDVDRVRQNRVVLTPRRWRQVLRKESRPYRAQTRQISADDGGKRARSPGSNCIFEVDR
jgi:hypothetical protein